ncbi:MULTISPECIES: hypothetical protein [unclassified Luteimonas]
MRETKPAPTDLKLMAEGLTVPAPFALMPVTRLLQPLPAWAKPNHGHFDCQHLQASTMMKGRRQRSAQGLSKGCMLLIPLEHGTCSINDVTSQKPCLQGVFEDTRLRHRQPWSLPAQAMDACVHR